MERDAKTAAYQRSEIRDLAFEDTYPLIRPLCLSTSYQKFGGADAIFDVRPLIPDFRYLISLERR